MEMLYFFKLWSRLIKNQNNSTKVVFPSLVVGTFDENHHIYHYLIHHHLNAVLLSTRFCDTNFVLHSCFRRPHCKCLLWIPKVTLIRHVRREGNDWGFLNPKWAQITHFLQVKQLVTRTEPWGCFARPSSFLYTLLLVVEPWKCLR